MTAPAQRSDDGTLRLLSLNIQVGHGITHPRHYLTHAWKHVLPHRGMRASLDRIAELSAGYDVLALQEADAGSLRTQRLNQVEYIAEKAGFRHWHAAVNRDLAPFARHALGVLSRVPMHVVQHHTLPGRVRGRGALEVELRPTRRESLRLVVAHLSLGRADRTRQLQYLGELARDGRPTVLLGDLNCDAAELGNHAGICGAGLRALHGSPTFPSWGPTRAIDHVLASAGIEVTDARVLEARLSDHLPVATEIRLRALP